LAGIEQLEAAGPQAHNVRHLLRDEYRQRVGDYRLLFRVTAAMRLIQVQRIERRTSTTYRKH
jgi:mRNA-degrading endonuclease RelE of RelBE toxin-antitoxin system